MTFQKGKVSWNKGIPQTEEQKRKNSESHKGKPSPRKGKYLSEETKLKMRKAKLGKHVSPTTEFKCGEDSIVWAGGRRVSIAKRNNKRRHLQTIPLNKEFFNSEGHHIDKSYVIYIPYEWHCSIRHNVYSGYHMEIINTMAFFFLLMQNIEKLREIN